MKKLLSEVFRVLRIHFVVLLLIIGIFALGYYFRRDIQISYHKFGMESVSNVIKKQNTWTKYNERFEKHEKALIDLGYFTKQTFNIKFLTTNNPQRMKMIEEFMSRYPGSSYCIGVSDVLTITDRPERMPIWEELIEKYDVPFVDPNKEKM